MMISPDLSPGFEGTPGAASTSMFSAMASPISSKLAEPLSRPLGAGRRMSPQEAQEMSEIYAGVAEACGKALLAEVYGPNSHERFDATLANAVRLFDALASRDTEPSRLLGKRQNSGDSITECDHQPMGRTLSSFSSFGTMARQQSSSDVMQTMMTRDEFQKALEQQGFRGLACPEFVRLWDAIGPEGLDLLAFHAVLRHLKLHLLCGSLSKPGKASSGSPALPEETGFVGFIDWCPRKIEDNYFHRPARPLDMFLTHRNPKMKMRWVHCANVGRPTILRLAVKYQLHPLPVEDTIQLAQQSVPIVRKYNDNFFMVIPLLRLTASAKRMLGKYRDWRNSRHGEEEISFESFFDVPEVEQCRLAVYAAGPPKFDTVISVMTDWKVSKLHADHTDLGSADQMGEASPTDASQKPSRSQRGDPEPSRGDGQSVAAEEQLTLPLIAESSSPSRPRRLSWHADSFFPDGRMFEENKDNLFAGVVRQIQRDYSMLRAGNSSWLLWRLLDVTVDELTPILSAYRAQLRWFSSLITKEEARVPKNVEKRLLRSKVELDWLQRKVRPMVKVIKHLIRDQDIDRDVTRYLEDIEDHLGTFLEEVSRIIGVCNSLRDEVNSYRDRQQQKVLYVLTLVTTLVIPTHLLTGIYGMNWQDEAGRPVVPGLGIMHEHRGYVEFWGVSITMTIVIYIAYTRVLKWI